MTQKLVNLVDEINSIGQQIADLSKKSKLLRLEVSKELVVAGLQKPSDENPTQFAIGSMIVTVAKARDSEDFSVTYKQYKNMLVMPD
jgi:hypothetical protein